MCLRNLQKYMVYGALIKADKLTSLLPMYFLNMAWMMGTSTQLMGVSTPPKVLQIFLCVSGTSKKYLVYEDLIEAEILTTHPQGICSTYPCYLALALYTRVCQHLPSSLVMFLCVSGTSKKVFGSWGLNRSWDIDLHTPTCICLTHPSFKCWHSAQRCVNTFQVIWKHSYLFQ